MKMTFIFDIVFHCIPYLLYFLLLAGNYSSKKGMRNHYLSFSAFPCLIIYHCHLIRVVFSHFICMYIFCLLLYHILRKTFLFVFQTGTLTEEGLDMWGAVPTTIGSGMGSNYNTIYPSLETTSPGFNAPVRHVNHLTHGPLLVGMTACHSLTRIDGNLIGDPLDLKVKLIRLYYLHYILVTIVSEHVAITIDSRCI